MSWSKKAGGFTIGVTYGKGLEVFESEYVDVIIASGLERGGGRETALVLGCDAIICINGGSGTLTEMLVAYQAGIPIVAMSQSWGWSQKLSGQYIDDRKRILIKGANTAEEAVDIAMKSIIERK